MCASFGPTRAAAATRCSSWKEKGFEDALRVTRYVLKLSSHRASRAFVVQTTMASVCMLCRLAANGGAVCSPALQDSPRDSKLAGDNMYGEVNMAQQRPACPLLHRAASGDMAANPHTRCNLRQPWPSHGCALCSDQGSGHTRRCLPCHARWAHIPSPPAGDPFLCSMHHAKLQRARPVCINLGLDLRLPRTGLVHCSSQHRHPGP